METPITRMSRVAILPQPAVGKAKPAGAEVWQIELDGHASFEVRVDIPPKIHNLRDRSKRAQKVRELVTAEAERHFKIATA